MKAGLLLCLLEADLNAKENQIKTLMLKGITLFYFAGTCPLTLFLFYRAACLPT